MSQILAFPGATALSTTLLGIGRGLPPDLPPPMALQPPPDQPGSAIRLRHSTPLRRSFGRMALGNVSGLTPDDASWPVDGFVWLDAEGVPLDAEVTTHDLLAVGTVLFPEGSVPVPGAFGTPGLLPLEDGETGLGPLRLHTLLRLAAACGDREGMDLLLQPASASVLVVPEDLIATTAWALIHVARVTHPVRGTGQADAPLRLLVLRGGGGDGAALSRALTEETRLVVLTTGALPEWPEGVELPDWLGLPPIDGALIERQIAELWPDAVPETEPDDPEEVDIADWVFSNRLPPDAGLARLAATDLAAAFSEPTPEAVRHALHRLVRLS